MSTQSFTEGIDAVWRGSIDMHVHAASDPVSPRRHDALDLARACRDAGMRAIVFKSYEYPTVPAAHLRRTRMNRGDGIEVLGQDGRLLPVVHDLLDIIGRYEMMLATGHLAPEEQRQLVPEARRRGIKTVITHAEVTPVPVGVTVEFSQLGAFVEHSYIALTGGHGGHSLASIAASIREAGTAQAILLTDLGQAHNPSPPEGFRTFIAGMLQQGFEDAEVRRMVRDNPATLLGIA